MTSVPAEGRHVRQRVEAVFWTQLDFIDRLVVSTLAILVHTSRTVDVTVWRAVELGRVGFEGMRAELFDIDGDRRRQALWSQNVELRRPTIGVGHERARLCLALALLDVTNGGVF